MLRMVLWRVVKRLLVITAILALPVTGYAQEAVVSGTVTDTTGGVLPGVAVTALHEASGNTFEAVTDGAGAYRLAVRTGVYRMTAELAGFATITRTGLELLVGQQAVVNLQMAPSAVQESVTVTGEAPLIDPTSSILSANIDPRQLSELPVNGRNWLYLTALAPGSRGNAVGPSDELLPRNTGTFQLNIDGQQVTNIVAFTQGQPHYSRDAIAEFQFISNRFDATQGRSSGVQVNAITKSGTNTPSGTLSGYFRDDRLNAADFIQQRVLPYSDQQVSGTFGGPIRKDKIHIFGNYEYEREPQTFTYSSPYPRFNIDQTGIRREHKGGMRLDVQFSSKTRLAMRGSTYTQPQPYEPQFTGGADVHPSGTNSAKRFSNDLQATLIQVLSSRAVNEVKVGYAAFYWSKESIANWPDSPTGTGKGAPAIFLRGYRIGQRGNNIPLRIGQDVYSVRDDLSYSFDQGGRHDLKLGGEYQYHFASRLLCLNRVGRLDAQGGPIPGNIEDLFPVWNDVSTWNLAPLSPITRTYTRSVGSCQVYTPRPVSAAWLQDDWKITPRLTLNLGLRYDLAIGVFAQQVAFPPFLEANRPEDTNNIGPRLGFAFSLNNRTVLRGGFGKYFSEVSAVAGQTELQTKLTQPVVVNDGRPDFAANPFNGPPPTYEEVIQSGLRRSVSNLVSPDEQFPYSYQTSIGVQRQLGETLAIEADYLFTGTRHDLFDRNINLNYNPATGANYPFTDISTLPYPNWGVVLMTRSEARSNYHALQTAFTKRFSQRWQASGTYSLSGLSDADPVPPGVTFRVAPDLGGEWTLATTDQRHRAVFNGIWEFPYGFQLSGLYFFGSGERFSTTYGGDLRQTGQTGAGRLRPDGTIVPRNNFVGRPIHRVDLRLLRRVRLGGRARVDGIMEVFNLFNHENYGSYVTQESARNYGAPSPNLSIAYQPRMLQLGFRFAF